MHNIAAPTHERTLARLRSATSAITTATVTAMDARHEWFRELPPESRSWITVVARAGIDGFVAWYADAGNAPTNVFGAAPRALLRKVSLAQTVELVRTTIDVCGEQLAIILPESEDRSVVERALLDYSREVAFAAATVYARAAELRGTWDARLEALVVDTIVRGDVDESTLSRASTLGWHTTGSVCVVVGAVRDESTLDDARLMAGRLELDVLAAPLGERMVLILGGDALDDALALAAGEQLEPLFGPGPVVVGPVVEHLIDAGASARAAVSGLRAAVAWPAAPRCLAADDVLPERALAGDADAQHALAAIAARLVAAGGDLAVTTEAFLDQHGSVEATARALFVHANTVRYRLKRVLEVSGLSPADSRDAFVLRLALTYARLLG